MKKLAILTCFLFISIFVSAQSEVDSLVKVGITHHDNGEYEKAIKVYKEALKIEPNSPLVHYELAMTYMYAKEYKKSIEHSDMVIKQKDEYVLPAYIAKGSCLDELGKTKESIKLFEKAIKQFGDHYLLCYNLGLNYYKERDLQKSQEILMRGIASSPNHASSHLLLGFVMSEQKQKVQSLLSLHYFLLLEPNTERSKTGYQLLQNQFAGNVEQKSEKEITIYINPNADNEFSTAELMLSMLAASQTLEKNKDKTDEELFAENTASFFKTLGELKKKKNKGLWWEFYVPLFNDIAQSEHIDTYCYFISSSSNMQAVNWLKENDEKITGFSTWIKENGPK